MMPYSTKEKRKANRDKRMEDPQYHANKKAQALKWHHQWKAENPHLDRAKFIQRTYGLDWESYTQLYESQNGGCAICRTPIGLYKTEDSPPILHVDHCHDTGKVRGLLCRTCNVGLGHFKDNATMLRLAAEYLER